MTAPKSAVSICELLPLANNEATIRGWIQGSRTSGKIIFLLVRDGTGTCQCTVEAALGDVFESAKSLSLESSIELTGTVSPDDRAPGGCELHISRLRIIHEAQDDYPISRKAHGVDFLMNHRHLWLRSQRQASILKIRHTIITAIRSYFDSNGFTLIDTPIFSPGAAEGAGTLFPVDYFGEEVYLAQTGQLYLESACMALGKVYCFGPTFRAEKSKTRRHLTEFWMVEPEIAFAELPDIISCAEDMTCKIVRDVLDQHEKDLLDLGRDIEPLKNIAPPFPRMTYSDAVDLLRSDEVVAQLEEELAADRERLAEMSKALKGLEAQAQQSQKAWKKDKAERELRELRETIHELEVDIENRPGHIEQVKQFTWGKDLGGAEETILSRQYDKPLFVTEYPREAKAFYMKTSPSDNRVVLNLDMLAPEGYGEIIGGSQREDDLKVLLERMKAENMDTEPYEWYLDLRRYGSVPHGGFGLGIERTVSWICGLKHVRETIPFARLMGRMYP